MCGIVGYIGKREAAPILVEGLRRLEYRGYDSAGIACVRNEKLSIYKSKGKVRDLERSLPERLKGTTGIAHTRWATHGEPSDRNAHPHTDASERFAIVHNGIVENAAQLRSKLQASGVTFRSETDSEVLAHLIAAMPGRQPGRAGSRRAAARHWNLRPRGAGCRKAGNDRRRAQRQPCRCSALASAKCSSPPTPAALEPHAKRRAPGRWRDRSRFAPMASRPRRSTAAPRPKSRSTIAVDRRILRQGRLLALHAQGDRRAARGDSAHARAAASSRVSRRRTSAAWRWRRASCWRFVA